MLNRTARKILKMVLLHGTIMMLVSPVYAQEQTVPELEQAATAIRLRQYQQASELLRPLADQGNPEAQYQLAALYRSGRGVTQDLQEYLRLLKASADGGYGPAQYQLGLAYETGSLVEADLALARQWLSAAADQGLPEASDRLAALNAAAPGGAAVSVNPGSGALRKAVLLGDSARVKSLLENGAEVDAPDDHGRTALLDAASAGDLAVLSVLLDHGANPNAQNSFGDAPLLAAVRADHAQILGSLLEKGANPDIRDPSDNTPLILAAGINSEVMVKLLVEAKANLNLRNDRGWTAADTATARGYSDLSGWLVGQGALLSPNAAPAATTIRNAAAANEGQWTTLMTAAWRGDTDKIRELRPKPAELEQKDGVGQTSLSLACRASQINAAKTLLRLGAKVNTQQENGYSPLMWASKNGDPALVAILIGAGANIGLLSADNLNALALAISGGSLAAVDLLLEAGAAQEQLTGTSGQNALMLAAQEAHPKMVARLASQAKWIDQKDNLGRSAVWLAAKSDCGACITELVANKASANMPDKQGIPPLVIAASKGNLDSLQALLNAGAAIDQATPEGNTALLAAAGAGQVEIAKVLLKEGAAINERNSLGDSPLIEATLADRREMVRFLLESGADTTVRNRDRLTARAIAEQNQLAGVLQEFDQYAKRKKGIFGLLD
jgi:ankyrin repeat protein